MTPPPVSIGLLICEQVIVDQATGNPSPISVFTGLIVDEFPTEEQRFSVFACLTNGRGRGDLKLTISALDQDEPIYEQHYPIQFLDPLLVVNVHIRVRRVRFPEAGQYEVVLRVDDDIIGHRLLRVRQR